MELPRRPRAQRPDGDVRLGARPADLARPGRVTWELDGDELLDRAVAGPVPPQRSRAVLVYDRARRHALLFGGADGTRTMRDDTCEAQATLPLGAGCTLHVGGNLATVFTVGNLTGDVEIAVPIPASAALRGFALTAQTALLDPAAPLGFALTQGLAFTVGD